MVNEILSGIVKFKAVRFLKPPNETYAVYFDDVVYRGADDLIAIEEHSLRIEVYANVVDYDVENGIDKRLRDLKLGFEKGERVWIDSEQIYLTPYYVEYTNKTTGGLNV